MQRDSGLIEHCAGDHAVAVFVRTLRERNQRNARQRRRFTGRRSVTVHFASGTNRFWRVLHRAGFTPHPIAPPEGEDLLRYGCGLTVAVARPTAGANDLSRPKLRQAKAALESKIKRYAPRIVAFLGKPAYGAMTGSNELVWGRQPGRFGGAEAWVLPNPSGRNRSFSFEALVHAYSELEESLDRGTATVPRVAAR